MPFVLDLNRDVMWRDNIDFSDIELSNREAMDLAVIPEPNRINVLQTMRNPDAIPPQADIRLGWGQPWPAIQPMNNNPQPVENFQNQFGEQRIFFDNIIPQVPNVEIEAAPVPMPRQAFNFELAVPARRRRRELLPFKFKVGDKVKSPNDYLGIGKHIVYVINKQESNNRDSRCPVYEVKTVAGKDWEAYRDQPFYIEEDSLRRFIQYNLPSWF